MAQQHTTVKLPTTTVTRPHLNNYSANHFNTETERTDFSEELLAVVISGEYYLLLMMKRKLWKLRRCSSDTNIAMMMWRHQKSRDKGH